jgi:hypothetical protein
VRFIVPGFNENNSGLTFHHQNQRIDSTSLVLPFVVFVFLVIVKLHLHFRRSVFAMFHSNNFAQIPDNHSLNMLRFRAKTKYQ